MKYIPSIAFEEMSGSAKGVTAAKTMGRKYIRNRGYGGGTRTAAQAAVKSVFKQLSQGWKTLTNEQILAWNSLALSQTGRSVLGTSSKITGSNLYMRLNYWIVYCGGDALTEVSRTTSSQAPTRTAAGTRKALRSPGCIGFQEDLYPCHAPYSDQVFPTLRIPPFYAGS